MQHLQQLAKSFNEMSEACGLEPVFRDAEAEEKEHTEREDYWYAHPEARE